ncbi:MAG TPA: molybdopterin-dependent oxidoreductase, partial [Nitrospiraceae bacterium]|nr:molybdopterin-dependent oxidoreductase [Nitrospiraceae bacterium]
MSLSRRQFLRASAGSMAAVATPGLTFAETMLQPIAEPSRSSPMKQDVVTPRNSIGEVWGIRTPYYQQWPDRVDSRIVEEPERWIQSTCILCSNGCGMDVGVKKGRMVAVRGRDVDRVNHGRLGPKGLYGWEANYSPDRLRRPLIRTGDRFVEATWDEAMRIIVDRSKQLISQGLRDAIAFYTSGQLFLEEYYTLSTIGKGGIGTPHMDGNTRLCTATNSAALEESFGTDGQPGSYTDLDTTDAMFLVGHNMAETQTVLWMRILDRLEGPHPPKLIVVDPRKTPTARRADIHIMPNIGSNVPVMNGLLHLIIQNGKLDHDFIDKHTVGFEHLVKVVAKWTPERVEKVANVPVATLRAAADVLGSTPSLVSTALQGVYQSMQATAAAVQINNVHLIRGLIGKPGSGLYQMNGQPTAQNTRECGADGDMPGNRNWNNHQHVLDLARIWNVDPNVIPAYKPPTHAMEMFHYANEGSIKMLWISGTNPAVSLPELSRIRRILEKEGLLVIVQDAFMTETAQGADIVLPTALWGEKTGCFTNVDRTVHISHKAIEPPGEAKSDLDIFIDYARRMDFKDLDGKPLVKWTDPESAFGAWKRCSSGRPCDYTGLSYAKLTGGSGIQ